jgi:chromatin assembly factor 1 subunit B
MTDSGPMPPKKIILDKKNPAPVHVSIDMPPPPVPTQHTAAPSASMFALPYRLMYAVAAQDSVLLYDTQQAGPIAIFKGLHYSAFTDVAW